MRWSQRSVSPTACRGNRRTGVAEVRAYRRIEGLLLLCEFIQLRSQGSFRFRVARFLCLSYVRADLPLQELEMLEANSVERPFNFLADRTGKERRFAFQVLD